MILPFKNLYDLQEAFQTEQDCIDHLEELRWRGNVVSPFDPESKVYKCANNRFRCKNTKKYFNVKTGTLFDSSKVELRKWFMALYLASCHSKGISSHQLARDIGVTQKTAWFMLHRIRNCLGIGQDQLLEGEVEIDETFVGGKNRNRHWDKKIPNANGGKNWLDKTPVLGMIERSGRLVARQVSSVTAKDLIPQIFKHINPGSTIYSDEWGAYGELCLKFTHRFIRHNAKQYVQGRVHTNTIEGFWSLLKRNIIGIYHYTSRKHLQKYVDECVYRYNMRHSENQEKFNMVLSNLEHRLRYIDLTS